MKKFLVISVLFFLIGGCAGFPKTVNVEKRGAINFPSSSVNLVVDRIPGLEKIITPEVVKRVESLFKEKLAEKKLALEASSSVVIRVIFEKYEDGNISGRAVSGLILGINVGEPAKIKGHVTISESQKEVTKADVSVESSRSGWNFSYGYGGAKTLESAFVEETLKLL
ncbi:MAG: hypothetical protein NTV77_00575 [Candidatus Azambacteria bacterium]|nr:hypothetical protein [Candidatus Azambacteria bacterium]